MDLAGLRVLLTGASRGIGLALARTLLEEGAIVALCARSPERLARAASLLAAEVPGAAERLRAEAVDVGNPVAAAAWVKRAVEALGGADVLVNNAAILPSPSPVLESTDEDWEETLRVNVMGTVSTSRAVLPALLAQRRGAIVNLSSGWGRVAAPRVAPYCASKFAVEAFSSSLAAEVPRGIAVVALNPGAVATDMLAAACEGDVAGSPTPSALAPRWRGFFRALGPEWNGRSLNLADFDG